MPLFLNAKLQPRALRNQKEGTKTYPLSITTPQMFFARKAKLLRHKKPLPRKSARSWSTRVTPTRVKTIQRVLAQQDAKRHLCALRLLTHFFTKEELAESNTDGSHDKRGLDSGKLNSLKILLFSNFPASKSEEKAKAWRVIKGKINSKCRVAHKSLKLPDSTLRSL